MRIWNGILREDSPLKIRTSTKWKQHWSMLEFMAKDFCAFRAFMGCRLLDCMNGDLTLEDRAKIRDIAIGHTTPTHIKKDADIQRPARMSGELFDLPR